MGKNKTFPVPLYILMYMYGINVYKYGHKEIFGTGAKKSKKKGGGGLSWNGD